jgi:GntR family transcriptional regulator, trigonelline degradation regulator
MMGERSYVELRPVSRVVAPVREQVLAMMRDAILTHVWKPGDRLVERDVCERTGASRSSVREVFRQLETEGLVTTLPNKGVIVRVLSTKEVEDGYAISGVIEAYAAREFCKNATEDDIESLRDAFASLEAATAGNATAAAISANDRFFEALGRGADNVFLEQTLSRVRGLLLMARRESMSSPGRIRQNMEEIRAIFEAVIGRNEETAAEAVKAHVVNAGRTAMAAIGEWSSEVAR